MHETFQPRLPNWNGSSGRQRCARGGARMQTTTRSSREDFARLGSGSWRSASAPRPSPPTMSGTTSSATCSTAARSSRTRRSPSRRHTAPRMPRRCRSPCASRPAPARSRASRSSSTRTRRRSPRHSPSARPPARATACCRRACASTCIRTSAPWSKPPTASCTWRRSSSKPRAAARRRHRRTPTRRSPTSARCRCAPSTIREAKNRTPPTREAQVMIRHPNFTGMQMDQLTREYTPAKFVQEMDVKRSGELIFKMEGGISISENPQLPLHLCAGRRRRHRGDGQGHRRQGVHRDVGRQGLLRSRPITDKKGRPSRRPFSFRL